MGDPANIVIQNCEYYLRIVTIFQVCLKQALLEVLHDQRYSGLPLNDEQQTHTLLLKFRTRIGHKLRRVLKPRQWDIICHVCTNTCVPNCPRVGKTNTQDFDITIICVLLSNYLTGLPPPINGWTQPLGAGDYSKGACSIRARDLRNRTIGHGSFHQIATQQDFDDCYDKIEQILIKLSYNNMQLFTDLKTSSLDPYAEEQIKVLTCELNAMKNKIDTMEIEQDLIKTNRDTIKAGQYANKFDQEMIKIDLDSMKIEIESLRVMIEQLACNRRYIETTKVTIDTSHDHLNLVSEELKKKYQKKYGYLNLSLEPKLKFQPVQKIEKNKIVVKLSLVPSSKVFEIDDEKQHIDMIQKKQKQTASSSSLVYKDIFKSSDDYVLISGVPGCGKTTLVETILYEWSTDELWKEKFDFVVVIYFRQLVRFKSDKDITCQRLLSHFYPGLDFSELSHHRALLILDGFDEFACKEDFRKAHENFSPFIQAVYDLVDSEDSPIKFTRLLTSRPGSCPILFESFFNKKCEQNLQILQIIGFDEENIERYVYNHSETTNTAKGFLKSLEKSPLLKNFMAVPFFCWGICYLINNKEVTVDKLPLTATAIYANILTLFIHNHGKLRDPARKLTALFHEKAFQQMVSMLANMAWILYKKRKLIFSSDDLKEFGDINVLLQSGLVIRVESDFEEMDYFQFMHYSFQEFLCALHVFYNFEKVTEIMTKNILTMVAGLCGGKIENSSSDVFIRLYASMENTDFNFSSLFNEKFARIRAIMNYFYEFQNEEAHVIVENMKFSHLPDITSRIVNINQVTISDFIRRCENHYLSVNYLHIVIWSPSFKLEPELHRALTSLLTCCTTLECNEYVLRYLIEKFDFGTLKEVGRINTLHIHADLLIDPSIIIHGIANIACAKILVQTEKIDKLVNPLKQIKQLVIEMNVSERPRSVTFHHASEGEIYRYYGINKSICDSEITKEIDEKFFGANSTANVPGSK